MQRPFEFEFGQYYHVFNRGVERRTIFQKKEDFDRFQNLLYLANGDRPVVFKRVQGLPLDKERGNVRLA